MYIYIYICIAYLNPTKVLDCWQGWTQVPHLHLQRHVLQCILWSHLQAKLPLPTPSSWEILWPGRDGSHGGCHVATRHHLHLFPRSCSMHLKHYQTGMLLRAEWKWHGRPSCLPSNTNAGPSKFAWKLTGYAVALWGRDRSLELHVVWWDPFTSNDNDWCNSPKPLHSTIEFRTMMTSQWDNWTAPPSLSTASRKPASGSIGNYKINVCEMAAVRGVTASMECPQQRFYQHVISNSTAWLSNHECLDMKVYPTNQGTHIQEKTPCLSLRLPIAELPSRDLMDWGAVETRPAKKWFINSSRHPGGLQF